MAELICDVFVTEPPQVELNLFECWIKGVEIQKAVAARLEKLSSVLKEAEELQLDGLPETLSQKELRDPYLRQLFLEDTNDQYRLFDSLEHDLCRLGCSSSQIACHVPYPTFRWMNEMYYCLDDAFCREIAGRKLNAKTRSIMDDISSECGIPLKSCRRQFDNLRRIAAFLENATSDQASLQPQQQGGGGGGVGAAALGRRLGLPAPLAARYAALALVLQSRFNVQSSKRKTAFLSASDLEFIALVLLNYYVEDAEPAAPRHDTSSLAKESAEGVAELLTKLQEGMRWGGGGGGGGGGTVARGLAAAVREARPLLGVPEVLARLGSAVARNKDGTPASVPGNKIGPTRLKNIIRACNHLHVYGQIREGTLAKSYGLLQIGSGLNQPKEYRDFIEDIICKVGEPLKEARCTLEEVDAFFHILHDTCCPMVGESTFVSTPSFGSVRTMSEEHVRGSNENTVREYISRYLTGIHLCVLKVYNEL